jgi:superfamily I DNA and/or RNA helicase
MNGDVSVGTVDKFQGQEGAVVIYSLATTSLSDVHRGKEFLLNDNRTNVAISRARAAVFMVASGVLISELSAEEGDSNLADFVRRASKGTGVRELLAGE